jgi:hypothetical protein
MADIPARLVERKRDVNTLVSVYPNRDHLPSSYLNNAGSRG